MSHSQVVRATPSSARPPKHDNRRKDEAQMAGIHDLPVELLNEIFVRVLFADRTFNVSEYYIDILRLELVCKTWRSALVAYATLWRYIDAQDPRLETTVERSKQVPLDICYHFAKHPDDAVNASKRAEAWKIISQSVGRWRVARILLEGGLGEWENVPSRCLQELHMQTWSGEEKAVSLFRETAPVLRLLSLQGVSPRGWTTPFLRNLRNLSLGQLYSLAPSAQDILQILQGCPDLEILRLNNSSVTHNTRQLHRPFIRLPRLHSIQIKHLPSSSVDLILSSLDVSSLTTVEVVSLFCAPPLPNFAYSYLNLITPALLSSHTLRVQFEKGLHGSGALLRLTSRTDDPALSYNLSFHTPEYTLITQFLRSLLGNTSAREGEEVEVHLHDGLSVPEVIDILWHLPRVTKLVSETGDDMNVLIEALSSPREERDGVSRWLLPHLRSFRLMSRGDQASVTLLVQMMENRGRRRRLHDAGDGEQILAVLEELTLGPELIIGTTELTRLYTDLFTSDFLPTVSVTICVARLTFPPVTTRIQVTATRTDEKSCGIECCVATGLEQEAFAAIEEIVGVRAIWDGVDCAGSAEGGLSAIDRSPSRRMPDDVTACRDAGKMEID